MSAGNAVFNEVLNIEVDTSKFAAQMRQIEQAYDASLAKMQAGTQQLSVFSQLNKQVEAIVGSGVRLGPQTRDQAEADMRRMAALQEQAIAMNKKFSASTAEATEEAATGWGKFGQAVETAAIRVPARLLVMAGIGASIAAIVEPIRLLNEGMENLEGHSSKFNSLKEHLKDVAVGFESVAATPVFKYVLDQMEKLSQWLKDNKVYVDNIALSFGNMATAILTSVVELAKTDVAKGAFKGLAELATSIAYAFSSALVSLKAIAQIAGQTGEGLKNGLGATWNNIKHVGDPNWKKDENGTQNDANISAIIAQHDADQHKLTELARSMDASIEGNSNQAIPDVPARNTKTLAELKAEFGEELRELKKFYDEQKNAVNEAVDDKLLSHQAAAPKIHAIIGAEEKAISGLVTKYKGLAVEVAHLTDKTPADIAKAFVGYDKADAGDDKAARKSATEERLANQKTASAARLKIEADDAKAEVALIKKAVSEGRLSREAGNTADIEEEQRRHLAAMGEISGRIGAPGSREEAERNAAIGEEVSRNTRTLTSLTLAHADAVRADKLADDAHSAAMVKVNAAVLQAQIQTEKMLGNATRERELTKDLIALKMQQAQAELALAKARLQADGGEPRAKKDAEEVASLNAQIAALKNEARAATYSDTTLGRQQNAEDNGQNLSLGDQISKALNLDKAKQDWDNANSSVEKMSSVAEGVAGAFGGIVNTVTQAISAYKQGGVAGALGSVLSGPMGDAMSAIPVVGAFVKPFGQILSSISGLFAANIQNIVTEINNKIADINNQASVKGITLQQQIKELQQEKQSAIDQLGGSKKKGASDELKKILKSLNQEIAQLQLQQKQTITNFNQMVAAASLGSTVISDWYTTWTQINQQVKDYVDAGGSLATAAQYLNQQLKEQDVRLQDQLNSGNQTAIADAIKLNDELTKRVQMLKDEAATEFGLLNADSQERRVSNAVKLGTELSKQRATFALQLADANNQISLDQQKVTAESKIFDINKNLAQLQAASNALTITSLNEQLAKYQDMQTLLKATAALKFGPGSIPTSAGAVLGIPGEPTVAGPVIGTVTINVNGSVTKENATSLANEIALKIRSGKTLY